MPNQMIFAFSGNIDFSGEYQLDQVCESLRDTVFGDDDVPWTRLTERLGEAGIAGATEPVLRAVPCVVEFDQEVAESVGITATGVLTRAIEPLPPRRTDPPPPVLQRALELVANDLEPGGAPGITLSVEPGRDDTDAWIVRVSGAAGSGGGSGFLLDRPFPELVAMLAELVQDHVIDEIWHEWPACPHHGHPLGIRFDGETAWWACGTVPDWRRAIGSLADDAEYVSAIRRRN